MSTADLSPVIIDFGSGYTKAGLVSKAEPSVIEPTAVGHLDSRYWFGYAYKTESCGVEGLKMTGRSRLGFPTTEGAVTNWDEMETFYRTIMWSRLNVHVEEQPIFLTINASRSDREKTTQIMFETLDVYVLSLVQAPYAALTASGRTAGLVIDSGHDSTSSAFFLDGQTRSEHVIFNKAVSGKRITNYLLQQLKSEEGVDLNKVDDFFSVEQIKQKHCFVPMSSVEEPQSILEPIADSLRLAAKEKSVSVSPELQRIGEAMFNPSIIGSTDLSIPDLIAQSISRLDDEYQDISWSNIIIAGGNSMFPGFKERLQSELKKIVPQKYAATMNLKFSDKAQDSAWLGTRAVALDGSARVVERKDWEEKGETVIHDFYP